MILSGKLFAHQWFEGVEPDIMAIAKALGGGFPIGAFLATREAAKGMVAGVHGSTFGGNPLAMAVGIAAFDAISSRETLANVEKVSALLKTELQALASRNPDIVSEIRGKGLLIGLKLIPNNRDFMGIARDHGLLVAGGGENCVRLLPSLLLSEAEALDAVSRIELACATARELAAKAA